LQQLLTGEHQPDEALRQGLLNGWVIVSEWVGRDGDRYIDLLTSHDARTWETLGWLAYGTEHARAQIQLCYVDEDGE